MISFIKSNSNILILVFLLFMTFDSFLLAIKFKDYLNSRPNLKISYDSFKSYCFDFCYDDEYKLTIINLTLKNKSTNSIDIINIKLFDGSKSYVATYPKIITDYNKGKASLLNDAESKLINLNISSENVLRDKKISSNCTLSGYAVFKNIELTTDAKIYKIIIETPKKTFEKEITLNTLNNVM